MSGPLIKLADLHLRMEDGIMVTEDLMVKAGASAVAR
jgi:hypothetical protein